MFLSRIVRKDMKLLSEILHLNVWYFHFKRLSHLSADKQSCGIRLQKYSLFFLYLSLVYELLLRVWYYFTLIFIDNKSLILFGIIGRIGYIVYSRYLKQSSCRQLSLSTVISKIINFLDEIFNFKFSYLQGFQRS